ncbi:MAG: hypothetical protein IT179_20320 [Acidobacteria bacterium]|nr:hypothetical protein [Acidobacteriota bacterium]
MNSNNPSDPVLLDLERDLPTTPEDVRVLRDLRRRTSSWLDLSADEVEALIPPGALEQRPPPSSRRRPFSLE